MTTIKALAQAVIDNYAAGMSGGDDKQFQTLIDLGDQASEIVTLIDQHENVLEALARATSALCDLHKGYQEREIAAKDGQGLPTLLRELVGLQRSLGVYDEGAWDTETTSDIPVSHQTVTSSRTLPVGTVIVSIEGESSTVDDDTEVHTGRMAEGYIERVLPNQAECYSVVFNASGVSVFLTKEEVANEAAYKVGARLVEGEIIGFDRLSTTETEPQLVYWNETELNSFVDGTGLEEYGVHNLHRQELARVGVPVWDWMLAKQYPDSTSTSDRLTSALRDRGHAVSVWSIDDLEFLDEDDDTAGLDSDQLAALKKALFEQAKEGLENACTASGYEHLSNQWLENQTELLTTVQA